MSDQAHSWSCPACDRRVPGRLTTCRCGYERDASQNRGTNADESSAQSGSMFTPARTIIVVLFVVGLAGLTASRMFRTTRDMPPSEPLKVETSTPAMTVADSQPAISETPVSASPAPGPSAFAPDSSAPAVNSTSDTSGSLEDVISRAAPAVVSIETRDGRGSGFFVGPGVLVTNNHVVGTNASVTVRLSSGSTAQGRVERTSPEADLAVVRLSDTAPAQPVLPLGSADEVRVGQEVIAIGLAMGQFQGTVTRGIISAVRRTGPGSNIVLLQTDAAINPGNSGGPLINRQGRVIGITTLKVSGAAESIGFAVAADHARAFLAGSSSQAPTVATGAVAAPPLTPAFTQKSQVEIMREQGLQTFEQSLKTVATRASQIDNYWTQVKRECGGRITGVYDREWFAVFENRLTVTSTEPGCLSALNSMRDAAEEVRTAMVKLHENARRASVYPGDLRQIRAKFDLDWTGWER